MNRTCRDHTIEIDVLHERKYLSFYLKFLFLKRVEYEIGDGIFQKKQSWLPKKRWINSPKKEVRREARIKSTELRRENQE